MQTGLSTSTLVLARCLGRVGTQARRHNSGCLHEFFSNHSHGVGWKEENLPAQRNKFLWPFLCQLEEGGKGEGIIN